MNKYRGKDFTFVVCAYKESPYLQKCIQSLIAQTVNVNIILVTSTPNKHIEDLVRKYQIPYFINTGAGGIAQDWNFGYHMAESKVVAIAHQDDIYCENYVAQVLEHINQQKRPLIAFTNYGEIRDEQKVMANNLLYCKRFMLFPLKNHRLQQIRFVRRRILAFGNAICCPSVSFVKENLQEEIFTPCYRSNVDWQAWEGLSKLRGAFVYCDNILMYHRIHADSETTKILEDNARLKEDYEMFCKFWPKWFAKLLVHFYKNAEKSNTI